MKEDNEEKNKNIIKVVVNDLKRGIAEEAEIVNKVESTLVNVSLVNERDEFMAILEKEHKDIKDINNYLIETLENIRLINKNGEMTMDNKSYKDFMIEYLGPNLNLSVVNEVIKKYDIAAIDDKDKDDEYINFYKEFISIIDFSKCMSKPFIVLRHQCDILKLLSNPISYSQIYVLNKKIKDLIKNPQYVVPGKKYS